MVEGFLADGRGVSGEILLEGTDIPNVGRSDTRVTLFTWRIKVVPLRRRSTVCFSFARRGPQIFSCKW